jgi:hypothetical protein
MAYVRSRAHWVDHFTGSGFEYSHAVADDAVWVVRQFRLFNWNASSPDGEVGVVDGGINYPLVHGTAMGAPSYIDAPFDLVVNPGGQLYVWTSGSGAGVYVYASGSKLPGIIDLSG